jgi:hypothetical protein
MRRRLAWLLTVPLVLAGSQLAHAVAYWVAVPDSHDRAHVLAATGHRYFAYAPLVAGLALATVVVVLALHARTAATAGLRAWPFALLPVLTFVLQEHLERLLHTGSMTGVVLEPAFLSGLALQLPFGLIALLIARALLRAAERIGAALRGARPALRRPLVTRVAVPATPFRPVLLVAGSGVRGPPSSL